MAEEARLVKDHRPSKEERAAAYRRRYLGSLVCAICMPLLALVLFVGPFIFTSWSQDVRITWWFVALLCLFASVRYILSHDKEFGYHSGQSSSATTRRQSEIVSLPPTGPGADPC